MFPIKDALTRNGFFLFSASIAIKSKKRIQLSFFKTTLHEKALQKYSCATQSDFWYFWKDRRRLHSVGTVLFFIVCCQAPVPLLF